MATVGTLICRQVNTVVDFGHSLWDFVNWLLYQSSIFVDTYVFRNIAQFCTHFPKSCEGLSDVVVL